MSHEVHLSSEGHQPAAAVARTGAISFLGAAVGGSLGLVLTLMIAKGLGSVGAGVALQVVAVLTITLSLAKIGMDTSAVFLLPRLLEGNVKAVPGAITFALGASAGVGTVSALTIWLVARFGMAPSELSRGIQWTAWVLPFGAVTMVGLACMRGLGDVKAFVLLGQVLLPGLRVLGVLGVIGLGAGAVAAVFAWSVPFVITFCLVLVFVRRMIWRLSSPGSSGTARPTRGVASTLSRFAGGRVLATVMEQALAWLDVLLVGSIVGLAAAGVYGTASRFVAAGLIVDSALRFAVAPVFSQLLARAETGRAERLMSQVTGWLILLSTPVYVWLGAFATVVLGWLGPEFSNGATAMAILCAGTALTLALGNVHSVLLMSGHSGWAAFNKAVVLAINVVGNLLTVPLWGIEAAAWCWAASMLLDAALATVEIRLLEGIRVRPRPLLRAMGVVGLCVGVPTLALRVAAGQTAGSLVASILVGGALLFSWCALDRRRLRLDELFALARSRTRS